jgi:hypothetical protein
VNISPTIQARVRQILGLTGGPGIEAIEAIQPVVVIAGYPQDRQPQMESGDMIVREFTAEGEQAAVAGAYSQIQIRTLDPGSLVWIREITIANQSTSFLLKIARSTNITALTYGTANWTDFRMPYNSIAGPFEIANGATAVPSTVYGAQQITVPGTASVVFPVNFILQAGTLEGLEVRRGGVNAALIASFKGIVFTRER